MAYGASLLDNLATHRSKEATQALRGHGCWFRDLPPFSPGLNPIEQAFSKLKSPPSENRGGNLRRGFRGHRHNL
ncbi:transposase [Mangrovicoccus sp. HB161399]|uniref:transposase n=1 Tax=Mangrovicoccus sp. HB161399 TaxID=2720392 RepID=UPI001556BA5A